MKLFARFQLVDTNKSICSSWGLAGSQVNEGLVLLHRVGVDALVVEAAQSWLEVVPLPHLEVLSEVLVSAPPVSMNHTDSLIPSHLMEVGVAHVVFLAVSGESSVGVRVVVVPIGLADGPSPLCHHVLLLLLREQV